MNDLLDYDQKYTTSEIIFKLKKWIESFNPEFEWNWEDLDSVKKEINMCCEISGAFDIDTLFKSFE